MAESGETSEQNLPETFKELMKLYDILEKTDEPTGSDKVQGYVYHACEMCKKAISMVNKLHLFSENEDIEEVSSIEMKYMMLPALNGYFLMKNTVRDRLRVVKESKEFYSDYMRMCKSYNVTKHEIAEPKEPDAQQRQVALPQRPQMPGAADLRVMAGGRQNKIQRYKEQKQLEKKLSELRDKVEQQHVDDEVRRDYYMTMLKHWVNFCIDELDSIQDEIGILEMMAERKAAGTDTHLKHKHSHKDEQKTQPLRPFIITKDMLQKQVYGLGYPGIPTMTIEEFFDKKVEEGTLHQHTGGHSMEDWARDPEKDKVEQEKEDTEKETRLENDDPDELRRAREFDEYKDEHRRGWGNRQNRH